MKSPTGVVLVAVAATLGVSTDVRLQRLEKMDLTNVRRKLQEPYPEGKGWTEAQSQEAEMWYKRYLATIIKYPDSARHVPNGPIDFFWHQHILDTMAYGPDCENVLGYFLHHYPYYGLNGDADARDTSFDETNAIYREMFGEDCTEMKTFSKDSWHGSVCEGSNCNGDSKDQNSNVVVGEFAEAERTGTGCGGGKSCMRAQSCKGGGAGGGGGCSRN